MYNYSCLPSHIITKILSSLNCNDLKNAILTCRAFYQASFDAIITRRICLAVKPDLKNVTFIFRPFVQLKLNNINFNTFNYIEFFNKFGHYIHVIILTDCNIKLIQLLEMFIFLVNLNEVKMYPKTETFDINSFVITEFVSLNMPIIRTNLSNIQKLELQSHSCNFPGLGKILTHTINLRTLIFNCYWNSSFNIGGLFSIMRAFEQNTLMHLEINYMHNNYEQSNEFCKMFSKLQQNNLVYLKLNDLSNLYHDEYFTSICRSHSNLEVLHVQQCNEKQMVDICRYMNSLRVLVLGELVTSSLKEIGNLSKVEKLYLYKDSKSLFMEHGVQELFEIKFKFLTILDISFPVTKLNLNTLCNKFQQLEHLKLRQLQTKYCYPIFKNLISLKSLLVYFDDFDEPGFCSEDINISNLHSLEELEINAYTFGLLPEFIEQMPKLADWYYLQNNKIMTRKGEKAKC